MALSLLCFGLEEGVEGVMREPARDAGTQVCCAQSGCSTSQAVMPVGTMEETEERPSVEELWQHFAEAEAAVAALGPTPEQLRSEASEAERLARESGTHAKTAAAIRALQRRWSDFLDAHCVGDAYGFDEAEGPTVELAVKFQACS